MHWFLSACRGKTLPHQHPDPTPWSTWLLMGGRGRGQDLRRGPLAGEQGLRGAAPGRGRATLHDVREVMVEGASGLRALSGPRFRPRWEVSRRRLLWPNGAVAQAFSAEDPDSLRGPQFHAAWADEFLCLAQGGRGPGHAALWPEAGRRSASGGEPPPRGRTRALKTLIAEPG
ncbi:terminase large subunit domain-containing protein, partial [Caulobacter sp. B11]|uniref:terminase large subunit domain-containing protein n=1 Tax=Caulobacter sp. B11 TaxID=2048899 RepID=UPI001F3974DB